MSRIDVQTLVLAFERRIEALEKNPPDKIPTSTILKMLEASIDDIIKNHFEHLQSFPDIYDDNGVLVKAEEHLTIHRLNKDGLFINDKNAWGIPRWLTMSNDWELVSG